MFNEQRYTMRRRLKSTMFVLASQMLLIALAITWLFHMIIIAKEHSIYLIESSDTILYIEIAATILIIVYAVFILINQIKRLGERRRADRN